MNKLLSCHYNMDTNRVEARFADGTTLAIDCIAIEDEYGNTPAQRAELDWLLYNKPLEYAQLVLGGEIEHEFSRRKHLLNHIFFRAKDFLNIINILCYIRVLKIEYSVFEQRIIRQICCRCRCDRK